MRLIDHYDIDGWGGDPPEPLLPRQRVALDVASRLLADRRGTPLRVLDVGCGDGSFLHQLATTVDDPEAHYIGVDYSEHQLAKAKQLPYEFHRCDLGDGIPLPDASVDLVHAAEILEHLYNPDLFADECVRVLRPGGHVLITTPNLHAWYNRVLFLFGSQPAFYETSTRSTRIGAGAFGRLKADNRPVGHLRLFHRRAVVDLLRSVDLVPVSVRGARFHGVPRMFRWLDGVFRVRPSLASILVVLARKR